MHDFFHGWQRKIGVVTLATALALMAGWMRSFWLSDSLGWGLSEPLTPIWLVSNDGMFLVIGERPVNWLTFKPSLSIWQTEDAQPLGMMLPNDIEWHFEFCGFSYARAEFQFLIVPYWLATIPLTLLSAYLLLSGPRTKQN